MPIRKINLRLRKANAELRAFMNAEGMNFNMSLGTFLAMVRLWADETKS